MLKSFLAGAVGGAFAVWWLKDPITTRVDARARRVRRAAANRLHAVAETIDTDLERAPHDGGAARDDAPARMAHAS